MSWNPFEIDPYEAQVFQINACSHSFSAWWLTNSISDLLQIALELAVAKEDFYLARELRRLRDDPNTKRL